MTSSVIAKGLFDRRLWRGKDFSDGVRDMLAVTPGVCAWGLVTGVAMVKSGMPISVTLSMSLLVFAASAQLAAVPLIVVGAPLWVIWLTAACVNLRFVIFSTEMRRHMLCLPWRWRLVAGYLTADMTFALMLRRHGGDPPASDGNTAPVAYFVGLCAVNWSTWNASSLLGVLLADRIPRTWGLELAGALALLGLMVTLASTARRAMVAAASASLALLLQDWPYRLNIVVAVLLAIAMGAVLESREAAAMDQRRDSDE